MSWRNIEEPRTRAKRIKAGRAVAIEYVAEQLSWDAQDVQDNLGGGWDQFKSRHSNLSNIIKAHRVVGSMIDELGQLPIIPKPEDELFT